MNWKLLCSSLALGVAVIASPTLAQDAPQGDGGGRQRDRGGEGGGGGGDRQRGDRPRMDPEQMQQRMLERMKEQLDVPDDEWAVLEPKIKRVATAQREARAGMMMGGGRWGGGPGGPGGPGGGQGGPGGGQEPTTEMGKAARDLREAVRNDNASETDLTAKLTAYRAAQEKTAEELKTARAELKEVVTVHQEAVLVLTGMLE
ncbi:MAG TPA: hypothetical protein VGN72_08255 [Tepidisphaeraceae bacterium]|jgi:hypothetical protein|nr:hypothetical protein [Tepidisphaeraceae bacterium]